MKELDMNVERKVVRIIIETQEFQGNQVVPKTSEADVYEVFDDKGSQNITSIYLADNSVNHILAPYYKDKVYKVIANSPLLGVVADGKTCEVGHQITPNLINNFWQNLKGKSKPLVILKCANSQPCVDPNK